jgi:hypothetical protein
MGTTDDRRRTTDDRRPTTDDRRPTTDDEGARVAATMGSRSGVAWRVHRRSLDKWGGFG